MFTEWASEQGPITKISRRMDAERNSFPWPWYPDMIGCDF